MLAALSTFFFFDEESAAPSSVTSCVVHCHYSTKRVTNESLFLCIVASGRARSRCDADILDPALLRPGRLDRKIEIPLPNETSRLDILKIHSAPITKRGEIDFESVVKVREACVCRGFLLDRVAVTSALAFFGTD